MIKKIIIILIFFLMVLFSDTSNALDNNTKFNYIYTDIKKDLSNSDLSSAKSKTLEFIDRTNFFYCNSYELLSSFDYDEKSRNMINNIKASCRYYYEGNFEKFDEVLKNINFEDYKGTDLYIILNSYYFSLAKYTVLRESKEKRDEFNSKLTTFLQDNRVSLVETFPITYGILNSYIYNDNKDLTNFNINYSRYLKDKDYYLKPFMEIYYFSLNDKKDKLFDIFKYENIRIGFDNETKKGINLYFGLLSRLEGYFDYKVIIDFLLRDVFSGSSKLYQIKEIFNLNCQMDFRSADSLLLINFFIYSTTPQDLKIYDKEIKEEINKNCSFKSNYVKENFYQFLVSIVSLNNFLTKQTIYNANSVTSVINSLMFLDTRDKFDNLDNPFSKQIRTLIIDTIDKLHKLNIEKKIKVNQDQFLIINKYLTSFQELSKYKNSFIINTDKEKIDEEYANSFLNNFSIYIYFGIGAFLILLIIIFIILKRK